MMKTTRVWNSIVTFRLKIIKAAYAEYMCSVVNNIVIFDRKQLTETNPSMR